MPWPTSTARSVGESHFFGPSSSGLRTEESPRGKRAKALKQVVKSLEGILLAQDLAVPGTIPGCKMLNLLQSTGIRNLVPSGHPDFPLRPELKSALNALHQEGPSVRTLVEGLQQLNEGLDWYSAESGPFASANFERNHAHAILGSSRRMDGNEAILFGVTIMAPYTRFPDHILRQPRVMFPLSEGDYRAINGEWIRSQIGSPILCAAGRQFAMRCASKPLLALWCQRLEA